MDPSLIETFDRHWVAFNRATANRRLALKLSGSFPGGLSSIMSQALYLIEQLEDPRIVDLARRLGLETSTTTRLVDRLETMGLAMRSRSANDRRASPVLLTDEGRKAAEVIGMERQAFLYDLLLALSPSEQKRFVTLFGRFANALVDRAEGEELYDESVKAGQT